MVDKQKRDKTIDVLRGLAIILVVVGHAIQSSYTDFDSNLVFRYIYASHMPLFMFVSGYAAGFSGGAEKRVSLHKKFLALMVPFFSWYVIGYAINQSWKTIEFKAYVERALISPDWGLWFLPVLFLCFILLSFGKKLEPKMGILIFPITWLILQLVPFDAFGLSLLKWHFTFFIIGYVANSKYSIGKIKIPLVLSIALGVIYAGAVSLWHRIMVVIDLSGLKFLPIPGHNLTNPMAVMTFKYLIALIGIAFWWSLVRQLKYEKPRRTLGYLGLFTMDIYVCHLYFFRFSVGNNMVKVLSSIALGLALPLLLSYILLRRFKLVNKLLLGGRPITDFVKKVV